MLAGRQFSKGCRCLQVQQQALDLGDATFLTRIRPLRVHQVPPILQTSLVRSSSKNKISDGYRERAPIEVEAKGALATKAARKKAIVAVARQLAVDLWRIRTGRLSAEKLGLIN